MNQERNYASFWLRFLAAGIDWIFIALIVNLFRFFLLSFRLSTSTILTSFIIFYPFFTFVYNVFCIYVYGATLGKRFAGIEVVREEGRITLFEAIRREVLLKPVSVCFFGIGIFTVFFNPKKQTYYDKKLHLVVLIKNPLSFVKRIFSFFIGFIFVIYLSTWTPFLYGILNSKNEQMKLDIIDVLNQKKEIIEAINDPKEKQYVEYYKKMNLPIKQRMDELCSKRILKIIDKKSKCTFEDLNLSSLQEVDRLYENAITGILDVQIQVQESRSRKFKKASAQSPEKKGWMRFSDLNNEYYLDYPKTFSAIDEGDSSVMFEKNIVSAPHGVDDYIFIQKGPSFQWKLEKIEALKKMKVGESKVIRSKDNSLPSEFLTFERLSDVIFGGKKIKAFVNKSVWEFPEGTILRLYIYESKNDFIFGGLTNEDINNKENISQQEFQEIITTIRFK